jgi:uncharacterized protein YtpQ (UPF0354 family)
MSLSSLKHKILPILKVIQPAGQADDRNPSIKFSESNSPVYHKLIGNLAVFFGIDTGSQFQLLMSNQVPSSFDKSLLIEASANNLARLLEGKVQIAQTSAGVNGFISDPDHTAALIILNGYLGFAKNRLGDDLIVAAPSKDILSFVPASDSRMIEELKKEVDKIHKTAERPLSKMLFKFDGESLSEYES